MKKAPGRIALAVLGLVLAAAGRARADLTFTLDDAKNSLKATADISFVSDGRGNPIGIEISVTNESGIYDSAHSISGLLLTINSATMGVPTALTEISGDKITYTKVKGHDYTSTTTGFKDYNPASSDPDLHWYLNHNGAGDFRLDNVGYHHIQEMIITKNVVVSSNVKRFDPYFNGTANFFLADSRLPTSLTTADIKSLTFEFGRGPKYSEAGIGSGITTLSGGPVEASVAPEPSTMPPASIASLLGIGFAWRRRRARLTA